MNYQYYKDGYSVAIRHYTILEIPYMIHTFKMHESVNHVIN
jgi:hypothetical protein